MSAVGLGLGLRGGDHSDECKIGKPQSNELHPQDAGVPCGKSKSREYKLQMWRCGVSRRQPKLTSRCVQAETKEAAN
jgi:hypothetical protein